MAFLPAIPVGGIAGLRFLDSTFDRQISTFKSSPDIRRNVEYFLENAENALTIDDLMGDRRLLSVVLGAFGLDDDINKGAFVRKVIEEGSLDPSAFANRLIEPAYAELAEALGFGNFDGAGTLVLENVRSNLAAQYEERQFELAVGEVDLGLRLAMNFRREAVKIAAEGNNTRTAWLRLIGSPPLREVVQTALNLPNEFAAVDIDQQVNEIMARSDSLFGISDPKEFLSSAVLDPFIDRFLANQQLQSGGLAGTSPGSAALTLLQSANLGAIGGSNLFASNF